MPWDAAWSAALYGPHGFYRRPEGPAGHFRTAGHAGGQVLAGALLRLAAEHGATAIVDVGAGRGELLTALAHPTTPDGPSPPRLHGVDVVDRPGALPARVSWSCGLDATDEAVFEGALVVAWEVLDVIACPVLQCTDGALRVVLVEADGTERLGEPAGRAEQEWCRRWWPVGEGERAEAGTTRDAWWAALVTRASTAGAVALLAVDYAHHRADRPPGGSLVGYRAGRLVPPIPDGSCDLTAHVALDAVAAAGERAGARTVELTDQRTALRRLGVRGRLREGEPWSASALARVATEAELIDAGGLGGFGWLVQRPGSGYGVT